MRLQSELGIVYQSGKSANLMRQMKAEAFNSFELRYEQLKTDNWQGKHYYSNWFKEPLNNARLALFSTYEGSHCAFAGLLEEAKGNLDEFHLLAEKMSRLKKQERHLWMTQPCADIAPLSTL